MKQIALIALGAMVGCVSFACGGSDVEANGAENLYCCATNAKPVSNCGDINMPCERPGMACGGSTFIGTESGLVRKSDSVPGVCVGSCLMIEQGVELNHCDGTGYVFLCSNVVESIYPTIKKCTPSVHQDTEGVSFWCCPNEFID